jgi:BASS family bile acid:Na+ symporter
MVGFLVFAVALDLKFGHFVRVLRAPRAPGIGLIAQFVILPAVAWSVGLFFAATPSVALGLLLVACCPGGALSNYLTGVARGDVATSISMTAVSTLVCVIATPLLFAFWASMNPATTEILRRIDIDPRRVVLMLSIMLLVPVSAGMLIRARRPDAADRMRRWVRRGAGVVFGGVVLMVIGANLGTLLQFAIGALPPVVLTFAVAVTLGWVLARGAGLVAAQRRAVALEVGMQNVALAIAMGVAFFPALSGVAITALLWGVVHLIFGPALALTWKRVSPA